MARSRFVWALLLALAATSLGCGAGMIPSIHSEAERLEVARSYANKGDCVTAIDLLKTYIAVNAGSGDVDGAISMLGLCYLHTRDWVSAAAEFERLLRDYPESDSSGSAAFYLGEAWFGQARPPAFDQEFTLKALAQWESYMRGYPGHWLNPEGQKRIAMARRRVANKLMSTGDLYLKLRLGEPARIYYERIEQEYPDTGLLGEAMLGKARALAMLHRRAEAIELLRQVEGQFAGKPVASWAARERKRLD